jgi:hypothetical protein
MTRPLVASVLLLALTGIFSPGRAGPYDVILANSIDLTLCQGCGITLAGLDYGLIVNTGTTDITLADLTGATFTVNASRPEVEMYPFINIPNPAIVGAIHPGEAMGSIIAGNALLLPLLRPGETLRNLTGMQFMAYMVWRDWNTYQGPIDFDVTMNMAGYTARFRIHAEVRLGPHAIRFLTATRVSAAPGNAPPDCSGAVAATPFLWPPDQQMTPVEITGVTDPEDDPIRIAVVGITQDEPVIEHGQSSAAGHCADGAIVDGVAQVRAERSGGGNGRVYRVQFVASDGQGNQCHGSASVCVPARPGDRCVEGGSRYDSFDGCSHDSLAAMGPKPVRIAARAGREMEYLLGEPANVRLDLFDVAGRRVASVDEGSRPAGRHVVRWSPDTPRGVYFLRVKAGEQVVSRRIVLAGD